MKSLSYWLHVWRMARELDAKTRAGQVIIAVPREIAAHVRQDLWVDKVQRAAEKWEAHVHEVTLPEWTSAMRHVRQERDQ